MKKTQRSVLKSYKLFAAITFVMLFLLLIRVPLGTFNNSSAIDTIAHFVLPATAAPLLYALLQRYRILLSPTFVGKFLSIVLIGIAGEALWEIIEFTVDSAFNLGWQLGNADTMRDIILAAVGTPLGAYFFLKLYPANKILPRA